MSNPFVLAHRAQADPVATSSAPGADHDAPVLLYDLLIEVDTADRPEQVEEPAGTLDAEVLMLTTIRGFLDLLPVG